MKNKVIWLSFIILFGFAPKNCLAKYSGGDGSPANPYRISNPYDMNDIGLHEEDWASYFVMVNDVNLAQFTGTQFNIIGTWGNSFTGVFDGNGFTISNFTYNSTGKNYIGIFGYVRGASSEIKNFGLIDPDVNAGTGERVGSLVGRLDYGIFTNCYVEGGQITGNKEVGGLVGTTYRGEISDCYSMASVTSTQYCAGGLIGDNTGDITNCYSIGNVSGSSYVGGLAGRNDRTISNSYSTGSVEGYYHVGGLVGYNDYATISDCYATGSVLGTSMWSEGIGGLVGINYGSEISNSYSTGSVEGINYVGGLVGFNQKGYYRDSIVSNCYSIGSVTGHEHVGGLVGKNTGGTISDCNAAGDVDGYRYTGGLVGENTEGTISDCNASGDGDGGKYTGGLVGRNHALIENCYATGTVSGGTETGGLVGENTEGTISDCNASGDVTGRYGFNTGGLVGRNYALIENCYATGDVKGGRYSFDSGGLVGQNYGGTISNSHATGAVDGFEHTGGLVGFCWGGTISSCYATGTVSGVVEIGGLVGRFWVGTISNSYATGNVSATGRYAGGLVGSNYNGTISDCYATGSISGDHFTGGLAGSNDEGTISNSYATTGLVDGNYRTGGLVGSNGEGTISDCYAAGPVDGNDCTGGLVGLDWGASYTKCFWDSDVNPDVNGIGDGTVDPNVIGETTADMQTESTFTFAGWDFVGETDNGTEDIWKMCYDPDYPHLFWEQCPRPSLEMPMHFTPRVLNPRSKGNWVKAHFILPEGFSVEDVNTNSPARIVEPFMADSNYMDVFINEDILVEIEAAFDRAVFCSNGSMQEDIVVIAQLTTGQYFYGTNTIKILVNNLEYLAVLTSYWLEAGCVEPDWCAGADLNRDSVVDFIDFAFFDGCCLEFIQN